MMTFLRLSRESRLSPLFVLKVNVIVTLLAGARFATEGSTLRTGA